MDQLDYAEARKIYERAGITGRVGFGSRPAVLVIDLIVGFTDPRSPLGADFSQEVEATRQILVRAREKQVPAFFTTIYYRKDMQDAGVWPLKFPTLSVLQEDSEYARVDPRLGPAPGEIVFLKKYPSAFFGTPLTSMLLSKQVDTLIVTGVTTSGCVRASAVDSLQNGLRTIIPREAVGDRARAPHEANLFDLDAKYADVVPVSEVLSYLTRLP
ncbi:MAG: isochorismatase family protein [Deltaproteobacteria bacterium]|nr:isochorismatase family protein [Deltaproteobacteria bacterium]MBI3076303.1 isochorismatase family protein [Deltaproteobacteria bacterium]